MTRLLRILTTAFVISFALDFKGEQGGTSIQFIMAAINAIAFLLLAVTYRMAVPRRGLGAFVFWVWLAFLLTGALGAFVNGTSAEQFVRVIYPFALFLQGFLVAYWIGRTPIGAETIVSAMKTTATISLFFTFIWGLYFTGHSFDHIRYQILSPLIPLLAIIAGYDLLIARRRRLLSFALLAVTVAIIALSVTRGMILFLAFVVAILLLAVCWNALRYGNFPRFLMQSVVGVVFIAGIGIIVATLIYPDVFERWILRSTGETTDVTFWIRAAAVVGQFQALTENPSGWILGQGFGSSYPVPVGMFPWILPYLSTEMSDSAWFPGEFMWMPFLYYGGFIVGSMAALGLLLGAARGFLLLSVLLKEQSWRIPQTRPLWIGILGFFSFLGMGFTGNPFIIRLAALFLGLCLGLIVSQGSSASGQRP